MRSTLRQKLTILKTKYIAKHSAMSLQNCSQQCCGGWEKKFVRLIAELFNQFKVLRFGNHTNKTDMRTLDFELDSIEENIEPSLMVERNHVFYSCSSNNWHLRPTVKAVHSVKAHCLCSVLNIHFLFLILHDFEEEAKLRKLPCKVTLH